jgi:hypothetical protein
VLTLKLHLILGFITASVPGTLLFVALLALPSLSRIKDIGTVSHAYFAQGSGPREREDLRVLVFIALLYGWPLIAVTYLARRGGAGFTAIVRYLILVYNSMIYMKI